MIIEFNFVLMSFKFTALQYWYNSSATQIVSMGNLYYHVFVEMLIFKIVFFYMCDAILDTE